VSYLEITWLNWYKYQKKILIVFGITVKV
jgi:hypothetical protein